MKVGLFSPYLDTLGGGERYLLSVAEFFLRKNCHVDFFTAEKFTVKDLESRFSLKLDGLNFVPDIFFGKHNFVEKALRTKNYDLIFFLSDGSVPLSFARKNILHFQIPFNLSGEKTLFNRLKLLRFQEVVCNSKFTKRWIDNSFGVNSVVLYPPVDVKSFSPGKKNNSILSVGRFFAPSHPKKQEIMVKAFRNLCDNGLKNWELTLCGGITEGNSHSLDNLKSLAKNYPITIVPDIDFQDLKKKYAEAKIYWHAAGFGEDLENHPERAEHFGITTVEAMASGAVPIVFAGGGQLEIISPDKNGFTWETVDELCQTTLKVIGNDKLRDEIAKNAFADSKLFSKENFFDQLSQITGF